MAARIYEALNITNQAGLHQKRHLIIMMGVNIVTLEQ